MIDKHDLSAALRFAGRNAMGLKDGDYFDSQVFDKQAVAVMELIKHDLEKKALSE